MLDKPDDFQDSKATAIQKAFRLMQAIANADDTQPLAELAAQVAMPKPTVHRLLLQLEEVGAIRRDLTGKGYVIGAAWMKLAMRAASPSGAARSAALPRTSAIGDSSSIGADSTASASAALTGRPLDHLWRAPGGRTSPRTLAWSASLGAVALLLQAGVIGAVLMKNQTTSFQTASLSLNEPSSAPLTRDLGSSAAPPRALVRFAPEARVADITALVAMDFMRVARVQRPEGLANLERWYGEVSTRPSAKA